MEGLSIIEGETLKQWELRLINIEQNQLALMKLLRELSPSHSSGVPDFITIENAVKKYNTTRTTIYNKIKLFVKSKGRKIDRMQMGNTNLVNEIELLEALRIKGETPDIFKSKKFKR